jgi:hypothetical protein
MDTNTKPAVPEDMMENPHGHWVPKKAIRPDVLLEDQVVHPLCQQALKMQAQLLEFRTNAFSDVDGFMIVLADKYGAKPRSASNTLFTSFDGLWKVEVSTGHFLTLGPELDAAKSLIDECLTLWSAGANENIQALVNDAFAVGEGGRLRVDRVLALRRVEITDPKWKRAMEAISDAVRTTHSKRYIRFHRRDNADDPWRQITLDVARVS